jgi:hypothetical protein
MKCRLVDKPYCDENFQIEFSSIKELEELKESLKHMLNYVRMCEQDGEEIPPLIYKIAKISNKSKRK